MYSEPLDSIKILEILEDAKSLACPDYDERIILDGVITMAMDYIELDNRKTGFIYTLRKTSTNGSILFIGFLIFKEN